jgi:hypothetical protein
MTDNDAPFSSKVTTTGRSLQIGAEDLRHRLGEIDWKCLTPLQRGLIEDSRGLLAATLKGHEIGEEGPLIRQRLIEALQLFPEKPISELSEAQQRIVNDLCFTITVASAIGVALNRPKLSGAVTTKQSAQTFNTAGL